MTEKERKPLRIVFTIITVLFVCYFVYLAVDTFGGEQFYSLARAFISAAGK